MKHWRGTREVENSNWGATLKHVHLGNWCPVRLTRTPGKIIDKHERKDSQALKVCLLTKDNNMETALF